ASYDRATPVNAAYLVPHGTMRYEVQGAARRPPEQDELAAMRRLVEAGLEDRAAGLASGLEYVPGRYGGASELPYRCAPAATRPCARGCARSGPTTCGRESGWRACSTRTGRGPRG